MEPTKTCTSRGSNVVHFALLRENGLYQFTRDSMKSFVLRDMASNRWVGGGSLTMRNDLQILFQAAHATRNVLYANRSVLDYCYEEILNLMVPVLLSTHLARRDSLILQVCERQLRLVLARLTLVDVVRELLDVLSQHYVDVRELSKKWLENLADHWLDLQSVEVHVAYYLMENRINVNELSKRCFKYLVKYIIVKGQDYQRKGLLKAIVTKKLGSGYALEKNKLNLIWKLIKKEIHRFCNRGSIEIIRRAIESGDLSILDDVLFTLDGLGGINSSEKFECLLKLCKLFIDNGARLSPLIDTSEEPFLNKVVQLASRARESSKFFEFLRYFAKSGVDLRAKNRYGSDALWLLCYHYKRDDLHEIIHFFCDHGADVKTRDYMMCNLSYALEQNLRRNGPQPYIFEAVKTLRGKGVKLVRFYEYEHAVLQKSSYRTRIESSTNTFFVATIASVFLTISVVILTILFAQENKYKLLKH